MVASAEKLHESDDRNEKSQNLEVIVANQAGRLINLGFHREVYGDLSEEEARRRYLADFSLTKGTVQPEAYKGRFDIALVVEPRISFMRQYELAKGLKDLKLTNFVEGWSTSQVLSHGIPQGGIRNLIEFPTDKPYLVWTHDAQKYRPLTVKQAVGIFGNDEVGSPQIEVTALYMQYPEHFVNRGIHAAGSFYESGDVRGIPFILGIIFNIKHQDSILTGLISLVKRGVHFRAEKKSFSSAVFEVGYEVLFH